jgi:hypothetical protein
VSHAGVGKQAGRDVLALAAKIALERNLAEAAGWNGFATCCTRPRAASAGSTSASCRMTAASALRDQIAPPARAGSTSCSCSAPMNTT